MSNLKRQPSKKDSRESQSKVQQKAGIKQEQQKYIYQPITTVNGQKHFKKYQKIKSIGKGTYSKCYLVRTVGSNSQYALKIIPKQKLQVLIKQKLIYQIKIQQQLSHPNIVYLDHWFQTATHQYIFMQYCPNGTLQSRLREVQQMDEFQIHKYVKQIVQTLIYIHSKNILHRDLKLCNFYIDQEGRVKLGDFGFACQLNCKTELKRETCGTPNYIAPQAISGFGYSFSADTWAVGVILYRLKYASCPFQGQSVKNTLENVKLCRYSFPIFTKISAALKDLITKIFNLNYDQRFTLNQIYNHQFFTTDEIFSIKKEQKQLKKTGQGFSLTRLFSSSKQKKNQKKQISPKNTKLSKPIRSNSCQTFKKIKQTFKQKTYETLISINTLPNQQNLQYSPLHYKTELNQTTFSLSNRQNPKSMRQIIDSFNPIQQKSRLTRLNQFLRTQQPMDNKVLQSKRNFKKQGNKVFQQLLMTFRKKYYLPKNYKLEKDILVVEFQSGLKILIYYAISNTINIMVNSIGNNINSMGNTTRTSLNASQNNSPTKSSNNSHSKTIYPDILVINKTKYSLYSLDGKVIQFEQLPKVLKYVIENKIVDQVQEIQTQQLFTEDIQTLIHKLPNLILQKRQGVLLRYGTQAKGYFIAKSISQQFQFISSFEQKRLHTLFQYNSKKRKYQIQEGPVLAKIYLGWTQQLLSAHYREQ